MKKIIKFISTSLTFFILLVSTLHSQNEIPILDSSIAFYPLHVSDIWIYDEYASSTIPPYNNIHRVWSLEIMKDTLMPNNEIYKAIQHTYYDNPLGNFSRYERIDTNGLKIYQYDPEIDSTNFEILKLDLSIEFYGTLSNPYCTATFGEIDTTTCFGITDEYRGYFFICGLFYPDFYYLKGLGLFRYAWYADFVQSISHIRGCVVNGILYGDTTVVSVDDKEPIPQNYYLFQNYPNPFNPSTKIKFTIPLSPLPGGDGRGGLVTVKVYDVLGNEIATLVNEEKQPGTYEVEFDRSGLPSGLYFYRLKADSFIETKKMILLK